MLKKMAQKRNSWMRKDIPFGAFYFWYLTKLCSYYCHTLLFVSYGIILDIKLNHNKITRVKNILKSLEKNTIFNEHPVYNTTLLKVHQASFVTWILVSTCLPNLSNLYFPQYRYRSSPLTNLFPSLYHHHILGRTCNMVLHRHQHTIFIIKQNIY